MSKYIVLVSVFFVLVLAFSTTSVLGALPVPSPTPGLEAMTIYQVDNPNTSAITVQHTIKNLQSTPIYGFAATVIASSSAQYHLKDMTPVPYGFEGSVELVSNDSFTAAVVGYDYVPTATPTPTATATHTATPTSTPTPFQVILPVVK